MYASAPLTVVEGETGAKFEGGELVAAEIDAARWMYADAVSAGPYVMKSVDTGALEAVLEINPNYAGNFEGVKPQIQQLVIVKSDTATQFDALATGAIDVLDSLSDGTEVNTALDMVAQGGYETVSFERNGYGKIQFQCDFGPTQFQAVRHAVAYLLDRNEFANTFCQGFGSVVHGPYGLAMWMFKESEELFADEMDTYAYDPAKAVEILEADGWVLDAEGNEYVSGVRYKEVTPEEAGDYELNVTLADGRILMPLYIKWSSSEANPVSELLVTMLSEGQQTADAGMVIEQTVMTFSELLNYMYRDATQGDQYGVKTYGMYNLATNFTPVYDQSYSFSLDPQYVELGYNTNYIFDEELDKLSMDMVYGVDPSDREGYLDLWQQFILKWNELLPEIPLYSNVYYTIYPDWLENFEESSLWEFQQAILYATVAK
jgi:peptide/nickel transport system substrate-binding protein